MLETKIVSRIPQPVGERGSLKWIQRAIDEAWPSLNHPILDALPGNQTIDWRSPLRSDDFAEYRDDAFLELLGLDRLAPSLKEFWPARGPQWDALGVTSNNTVLLVEAKAHIPEMCSGACGASDGSLARIRKRLDETAAFLGAKPTRAEWHLVFYQLANRLAHLHWLRNQNLDARLVMVNFINDDDMNGPTSREEWEAAYQVALYTMGIRRQHPLASFVIDVFPDVQKL